MSFIPAAETHLILADLLELSHASSGLGDLLFQFTSPPMFFGEDCILRVICNISIHPKSLRKWHVGIRLEDPTCTAVKLHALQCEFPGFSRKKKKKKKKIKKNQQNGPGAVIEVLVEVP